MRVVLVTDSDADPILCKLQCELCKQVLSPSNPLDACKTLKSSVCKGHHLGAKEGLIPTEQQHRAATGSSSSGQTGASSSIGFKRACVASCAVVLLPCTLLPSLRFPQCLQRN